MLLTTFIAIFIELVKLFDVSALHLWQMEKILKRNRSCRASLLISKQNLWEIMFDVLISWNFQFQ